MLVEPETEAGHVGWSLMDGSETGHPCHWRDVNGRDVGDGNRGSADVLSAMSVPVAERLLVHPCRTYTKGIKVGTVPLARFDWAESHGKRVQTVTESLARCDRTESSTP